MKKDLSRVAASVLSLLAALPLGAQTPATNAATISAAGVRGIPGSTVRLPLSVAHTGIVSAIQFDLSYNPTKMAAGLLQPGLNSDGVILRSRQIAPGVHRILAYKNSPSLLPTNTALGGLPFTVPAGQLSGGGRVTISNAVASSLSSSLVTPVRLVHGAVLVEPVYRGSDGVVDLFLTVRSNLLYVVQATTNFLNWANISTNFAALDYIVARDFEAIHYQNRFYRAMSVGTAAGGQISNVRILAGNQMTFGYAANAAQRYILQTSTNLTAWDNLTTNIAATTTLSFTNLVSPVVPRQFFRVLELP